MGEETDRQEKPPILQYLGTVGNSAAPPPFGLLAVSRCDVIFFPFLKVGSSARGNEFVLQVELSHQGGQGRRGRTSAIFFSYRVRVNMYIGDCV